jgi:hypothetical protein
MRGNTENLALICGWFSRRFGCFDSGFRRRFGSGRRGFVALAASDGGNPL